MIDKKTPLEILIQKFGSTSNCGVDMSKMTSEDIIECMSIYNNKEGKTMVDARNFYWECVSEVCPYPVSDFIFKPKAAIEVMEKYILL